MSYFAAAIKETLLLGHAPGVTVPLSSPAAFLGLFSMDSALAIPQAKSLNPECHLQISQAPPPACLQATRCGQEWHKLHTKHTFDVELKACSQGA